MLNGDGIGVQYLCMLERKPLGTRFCYTPTNQVVLGSRRGLLPNICSASACSAALMLPYGHEITGWWLGTNAAAGPERRRRVEVPLPSKERGRERVEAIDEILCHDSLARAHEIPGSSFNVGNTYIAQLSLFDESGLVFLHYCSQRYGEAPCSVICIDMHQGNHCSG